MYYHVLREDKYKHIPIHIPTFGVTLFFQFKNDLSEGCKNQALCVLQFISRDGSFHL